MLRYVLPVHTSIHVWFVLVLCIYPGYILTGTTISFAPLQSHIDNWITLTRIPCKLWGGLGGDLLIEFV